MKSATQRVRETLMLCKLNRANIGGYMLQAIKEAQSDAIDEAKDLLDEAVNQIVQYRKALKFIVEHSEEDGSTPSMKATAQACLDQLPEVIADVSPDL